MEPDHGAYLSKEFRCEDYERRERDSWGRPIYDAMICGQLPPSPEKDYHDLFTYYTGTESANNDCFWQPDGGNFDFEPAEQLWMNSSFGDWNFGDQSLEKYDAYVERVIQNVVETVAEDPQVRKRGRPRTKQLQSVKIARIEAERGLEALKNVEENSPTSYDHKGHTDPENPAQENVEQLTKKLAKPSLKFSLVAGLSMINATKPLPSREVYRFVKYYFPAVVQGKYWKNSIRHAMCTSDLITKVPIQSYGVSPGNEWTISPEKRNQFFEAIRVFEISYSNPATYGMTDPSLWKAISQGKQGLPAPDIFIDLEEPKRAPRSKAALSGPAHLQQIDPKVRADKLPRGQVRFQTNRPTFETLKVETNLEALIDQLPMSPISMDSCDLFYESPLTCASPQTMDFDQLECLPNPQQPTAFPFFSFE